MLKKLKLNIVRQWKEAGFGDSITLEGKFIFYLFENDGVFHQYTMDETGNLSENGEISREEMRRQVETSRIVKKDEYNLGKNKNIRLYQSNGTWKLVDANDEPLYDERYYECIARKECYFLVNEDNAMCLIDRNGNRIVDYGWLTLKENQIYFNGMVISTDDFLVGDDRVCFKESDVYFFSGTDERIDK